MSDLVDWSVRRARYYATHPRRCVGCKSRRSLDLHHLSYERRGRELDSDLVCLCHDCHMQAHQLYDALKGIVDLREATRRWLVVCRSRPKYRRILAKKGDHERIALARDPWVRLAVRNGVSLKKMAR